MQHRASHESDNCRAVEDYHSYQMKKVLFVVANLRGGGAEKVLVTLVNGMDKSKYDVTVMTLFEDGVNAESLNSDVHFISKKHRFFRGLSYLMKLLPPSLLYTKYVGKDAFDLAVAYMQGIPTKIVWGAKCKRIAWVHSDMSRADSSAGKPFWSLRSMIACYSDYDAVVGVADTVRDAFGAKTGITQNVFTCYNANDIGQVRDLATDPAEIPAATRPLICSVGRFTSEKGFDRLLAVCQRLKDENLRFSLLLIGEGPLLPKTKSRAKDLGLEDEVFFTGYQTNPYKYMSKSDIFVCSSFQEGLSTATTEAVILGLPVVSTLVSGAEEILGKNNEYGIVTENSDNGLFQGLRAVLTDSRMLAHYRQKATERAPFFDSNRTIRAVEALFENTCRKDGISYGGVGGNMAALIDKACPGAHTREVR